MHPFSEIWAVDFEFTAPPGQNPEPICMVAKELRSGRTIRLWRDELQTLSRAPFNAGGGALFVAYYASAEIGCFLALNWPLPVHILDLYAEFRNATNGLSLPCGAGLLGALAYYGIGAIEAAEKSEMRDLAMRGGPFTGQEAAALLDYCQSDVEALERLYLRMALQIDLPRALLRGRFMAVTAQIERHGVPLDVHTLDRLGEHWESIQDQLIAAIDKAYGIYDGRTFKRANFKQYLSVNRIAWPLLPSGELDLKDETFREMARSNPSIAPLRELRAALSEMRLTGLAVGADCRNRTLLSAFSSRTGRNQPSNAKFIFGPAIWLRGLIKPEPGMALTYIDWSQQEFAIAAALSGDQAMMAAYQSGDPYLEFAKQAGAVPPDATKSSHQAERERFKACALAVLFGMGPQSLSQRIGQSAAHAAELLDLHHQTYPRYWVWSDRTLDYAKLTSQLHTAFGWTIRLGPETNPRSLRNFPMQANGAEMLRLAAILGVEAGIKVCALVHDAILIEAPAPEIKEKVTLMQALMEEASAAVLGGFRVRSDPKIVRYPDRYMDPRGEHMWKTVTRLLPEEEAGGSDAGKTRRCSTVDQGANCDGTPVTYL
jgi:hypothetical protein